jgi:L-lysine exporter family protein LysE/ArgO
MPAATISITPFLQGFLLCASTIITVGPQNVFILGQGLRRQHIFATALFSTLARILLISLAVGGLSASISTNPYFRIGITVAGTLFLAYIGGKALRRAWCGCAAPMLDSQAATTRGVRTTIVAALCFAFLNPAIYMNTLMLIGSTSLNYQSYERLVFAMGAVLAATTWFFALSYGASRLTAVFQSPIAWRILDFVSGTVMLLIAATVIAPLI